MEIPRLVVVDDEPELCQLIGDYLGRNGFTVRAAANGRALDACLAQQSADLVILDVNMPEEDGFSVARRLRAAGSLPILMLTSAADVIDRVVALEMGVDDYLLKPFDLRELRARVRSILRRAAGSVPPAAAPAARPAPGGHRVPFGPVVLDTEAHCLFRPDGTELALTAMEYDLLQIFAQNPNRVLSRDRLLDLAQRNDRDPFDRSIDIRITRLRRKIELEPGKPVVLRTVRGTGYMFVPTAAPAHLRA